LVKETAEALARQFVDRPSQRETVDSSHMNVQPNGQTTKDVVPPNTSTTARQSYVLKTVPSTIQNPGSSNVQQSNSVQTRAVDMLLVVAGVTEQDGNTSSDGAIYGGFWSHSYGQEERPYML
jgi:hypothetical protein